MGGQKDWSTINKSWSTRKKIGQGENWYKMLQKDKIRTILVQIISGTKCDRDKPFFL